jgi:ornithine decarboxylase
MNISELTMNEQDFPGIADLLNTGIKVYPKDRDIIDIIRDFLSESNHPDTGFFIVDLSKVIDQYFRWLRNLPRVKPFYAVKSNPNPMILKLLALLGSGFDCASRGEISMVLELLSKDTITERVIFANPVKIDAHLSYARSVDVDTVTVDSKEELIKIGHLHPTANVILRLKVNDEGSICRLNARFGLTMSEVPSVIDIAEGLGIKIIGVSFHVGSGCSRTSAFHDAISLAKDVFTLAETKRCKMTLLDLGGGFLGTENSSCPSFEDFSETINLALNTFFPVDLFPELTVIAEPGRYFCASSHTLVLNIIGRKKIHTESGISFTYTLNDGIYGSLNCIKFDHAKPVLKPFNERTGVTYKCTVYGPTCDSMDIVSNDDCHLPELAVGECVYIESAGAYTTAAASQFNGFQLTPCHYIMSGQPRPSERD